MAENIAPTETQVTEAPATGTVIVSSPEEYLAERRKGTATGLISWRSTEDGKATEPVRTEAVKPESEAEKPPEPQTNEQVTSDEEPPKDPEHKEDPKPPEGEGKRQSLIADVQKQRQRAQQAERERDELRAEMEAYKKGLPSSPKPVETAAAKETTKAEAPKLEHPGKAPDFLSFDNIADYNKANSEYLEKLSDYKSAILEQKLSAAYEAAESEKEKKFKKSAEESEVQTLNQKFNERITQASKQFPDLLDMLKDPDLRFSGDMADIVRRDEAHGVAMAHYLATHPEESARIAVMRRHLDIGMAMGDIRALVKQAAPPAKTPEVVKPRTSNAPPPPVNTGGGGGSVGSTLEELATRAGAGDGSAFLTLKAKWAEKNKAARRF